MRDDVDIREEETSSLPRYGDVSSTFEVRTVLDVTLREGGLGGILFAERAVERPYTKDYDEDPASWAVRFDVRNWGVLSAWRSGARVGGAVIARDTPGVEMLRGRRDLAVVWDLRVAAGHRRTGVAAALFAAAERWAAARGCVDLEVETQNVNVPACRFYAAQGCELVSVDRSAYPELPHETKLVWRKRLTARADP